MEDKARIIQEYVPGRQITLAHQIVNPQEGVIKKLEMNNDHYSSIGIMTLTPGETAIIAADIASKSAEIDIEFIDRFNGTFIFTGTVSSVETALKEVLYVFENSLKFSIIELSKS